MWLDPRYTSTVNSSDQHDGNANVEPVVRLPLLQLVDQGFLPQTPEHDCPYLSDRMAREEAFVIDRLDANVYHDLMDRGFRRSGDFFYRPACESCRACVPLRVVVDEFSPSKSQRRVARRNDDVRFMMNRPELTAEKEELYARYLLYQHPDSTQAQDPSGVDEFLYSACVDSREVCYFVEERLIAVSIIDVCDRSISSVYHYFEPGEAERSPGVFSVLTEIEMCRQRGVPHYYMGYWVEGAKTMGYKANYQPHERLIDGVWKRL